ncbi:hypothetical protein B0H19DRAFT_1116050 [Mycena capillaripes]|nr:hypothetical protein B0H19DRAFT_1116050 [Mycena capillaripes]
MSTPPTKRQRTEEASITRSDIWYPDGSVVLQVQDTQFRVHWSVLAQHSSFFRDMQALPQPPDGPSVDGCPVVELQDAIEDVKHLLPALYDPTLLFQNTLSFPVVAALIRLGRKYDFRKLLDAAVELVMCENPATLEGYQAPNRAKSIIYYPGIEFDMLALVRENNIQSALPCAYYRVVKTYSQKQLFDGVARTDGTLATLAAVDLRQCNLSREKLITKQLQPGYTLGCVLKWDYNDDCTASQKCTKMRDKALRRSLESFMVRALYEQTVGDGYCSACKARIQELVAAGLRKTWEDLPDFFDLPSWNELKNDL